MITREMVDNLAQGQTLYHVSERNADGTPQRWKITSIKTWKTRPSDFRVRIKYGLKIHNEISPGFNDHYLTTDFPLHCTSCLDELNFSESHYMNDFQGIVYCEDCRKKLKKGK